MDYLVKNFLTFLLDPLAYFFLGVILLVSVPSLIYSFGYLKGEASPKKKFIAQIQAMPEVGDSIYPQQYDQRLGNLDRFDCARFRIWQNVRSVNRHKKDTAKPFAVRTDGKQMESLAPDGNRDEIASRCGTRSGNERFRGLLA